jgi:hypothetical protein
MEYTEDEILDVVQRWENTGLLYGLPLHEKQELAPIFDNISRIALSLTEKNKISMKTLEKLEDTMFPICRRLYRRVGFDFDVEKMVESLIKELETKDFVDTNIKGEKNPIVQFCIEFSDLYEDENIIKNQFNDEEYEERVDKILETLKTILLNKEMVSFVDKTNDEWKVMLSDAKKSSKQTRYWNQNVTKEFLTAILNDTNKGV